MSAMNNTEIAIVDDDVLAAMGLRSLLEGIESSLSVRIFGTFADYVDDTTEMFVHVFVRDRIYLEHVDYFAGLRRGVIVITCNDSRVQNVLTLNVNVSEGDLVRDLILLREGGHPVRSSNVGELPAEISPREIEVLSLVAQGYINKEIADRLCISLATVVSHRKNIQEKLKIKTVSGLTIYAILNGYVDLKCV